MTSDNPFPGMNPFLENFWQDVHTTLIAYIRDAIAENLPRGLKVRAEEAVALEDDNGEGRIVRADVVVKESWKQGDAPSWKPGVANSHGLIATEPEYMIIEEEVARWIGISDAHGHLITVIEVLSPTNKSTGRKTYASKRRDYISAGINVVEIDLLRGGEPTVAVPLNKYARAGFTCYITCVTRASEPSLKEVYYTLLHSPLPNISVPLRAADEDAVLVLQPLIDRCYRMGGYDQEKYDQIPGPPMNEDEATWVRDLLKEAGLVDSDGQ
jgi:Protein of unknown function (DUF4058)